MNLIGKNGYNISFSENVPNNCKVIIIAMHGFAGDKESSCIKALEKKIKNTKIGLIKFDWPAHGESETNGFNLTIKNCIEDLNSIIKYTKDKYKNSTLVAFATSFGGYITLLYNYYYKNTFTSIILRSPALNMYEVMQNTILTDSKRQELKSNSYFNHGFDRNIKVTKDFLNELKTNNLFELYKNEELNYITIIHGTADDVVPINDSINFSKKHNCTLYKIKGADHRYKKEGELEKVITITANILSKITS